MKKSVFLILIIAIILPLIYCSSLSNDSYIAVSIPPQKFFVTKITAGSENVITMLPPGQSPATYQISTNQRMQLGSSLLYAKVGASFVFENNIIEAIESDSSNTIIVDCSENVPLIQGDPHIWLSPVLVKIQVQNIYEGLIQVFPERQDEFAENLDLFLKELDNLDHYIKERISNRTKDTFMIFHPALSYFAREYGLTQIAIEKHGAGSTVHDHESARHIALENDIDTIFIQSQFNTELAASIAEGIHGNIIQIDPLSEDYITSMKNIADKMADALR